MINPVQRLYYKVFHFVSGDDGLRCGGEALEDRREDGGLDKIPGIGRVGVLSPGSADFVDKGQSIDHFGEALVAFQEVGDEVGGLVDGDSGDGVDSSGREIMKRERGAFLGRPGGWRLRKKTAL